MLLVRNAAGLRNLRELNGYSKLGLDIRFEDLKTHHEGLLVGCSGYDLHPDDQEQILELASVCDYFELVPFDRENDYDVYGEWKGNPYYSPEMDRDEFDKDADWDYVEEGREFELTICEICEEIGKPVVATGYTHNYVCVVDVKVPTTAELLEAFDFLGIDKAYEIVVTNTNKIADMCENSMLFTQEELSPKMVASMEKLRRILDTRIKELYGDTPPSIIAERIDLELARFQGVDFDVCYNAAMNTIRRLVEEGCPWRSLGSDALGLVQYLSGITEINPLPAHYRCPNCHFSDFGKTAFDCGVDMPSKTCPICGKSMIRDGFNTIGEPLLEEERDHCLKFMFSKNHPGQCKVSDYEDSLLKRLAEATGVKPASIDLGDRDVMSLFASSEVLGYEGDPILGETGIAFVEGVDNRFMRKILATIKPRTFGELVHVMTYLHADTEREDYQYKDIPKAHAVWYAMNAFRIAWYKLYYPLEFYCTLLNEYNRFSLMDTSILGLDKDALAESINIRSRDEMSPLLNACYEFRLRGYNFALPLDYDFNPWRNDFDESEACFMVSGNKIKFAISRQQTLEDKYEED
jgi:DNA polymerase III alpha subunit (gram-positive type)